MIKFIVSQDGEKLFTIGENNFINIAPVDVDEMKVKLYSIGINGVSFGIFKNRDAAYKMMISIGKFLCNDSHYFAIPKDRK